MASKKPKSTRLRILSLLGGAGYIALVFEWFTVLAAAFPSFAESGWGKMVFPHQEVTTTPVVVQSAGTGAGPDFVTTFLVTALAIALLSGVAYVVFVRYTRAVRTTGSKLTHTVVKRTVPVLLRHTPKSNLPKRRAALSRRVLFWSKVGLAVTPLALLPIILNDGERGIMEQLALFLQACFALLALIFFVLQNSLALRWHFHLEDIS